jgi:hypothetical protein
VTVPAFLVALRAFTSAVYGCRVPLKRTAKRCMRKA